MDRPIWFARAPSDRFRILATRDRIVANEFLSREFAPHFVNIVHDQVPFETIVHKAQLCEVAFYQAYYRPEIRIQDVPRRSSFLLHVPITGRITLSVDRDRFQVSPGQFGLVNPTHDYAMERTEDCMLLTLKLDHALFEKALVDNLGHATHGPVVFNSAKPIDYDRCDTLIRFIELIYRDLFEGGGAFQRKFSSSNAEVMLIKLLLDQVENSYSGDIADRGRGSVPYYVKRVEDYILRNAKGRVTMAELIAVAGVSARTLYSGFRRFRGISPMRQLKNIRLEGVRSELIAARRGAASVGSLTDIASRWGFGHMGNFSNDYKGRFGERPSETLRLH